uniref:Uncharacterized protein n=1 Tax=Triticum urartu TaxID=4572 RepID=A0A8R7TER5_TRIUA
GHHLPPAELRAVHGLPHALLSPFPSLVPPPPPLLPSACCPSSLLSSPLLISRRPFIRVGAAGRGGGAVEEAAATPPPQAGGLNRGAGAPPRRRGARPRLRQRPLEPLQQPPRTLRNGCEHGESGGRAHAKAPPRAGQGFGATPGLRRPSCGCCWSSSATSATTTTRSKSASASTRSSATSAPASRTKRLARPVVTSGSPE